MDDDKKVALLGNKKGDNTLISVTQSLQDALNDEDVQAGKFNRSVLILLDDKDDEYKTRFYASNIKMSEAISLLTIQIKVFMEEMGY